MTSSVASEDWYQRMQEWAREIAEMCKACRDRYPPGGKWADDPHYLAFCRREFRAAWQIFAEKNGLSYYALWVGDHPHPPGGASYPWRLWRDAVAREMGWLNGRLGDAEKEWVKQRRLEAAGQQRMFA